MKRLFATASFSALALAVLLMLPSGSVFAQSDAASNPPGAGQPSIDDATLQHTAKAFVKVSQISDQEKRVMSSQGDEDAKKQAAAQAESDKLAAVKAEGLQPQQYNQVLQVVQNDNNLQQKFLSYVKSSGASPDSRL